MQGIALSDYIKRAENANDPTATVLQLLKDLDGGKVSKADILAHYKDENWPRLTSLFNTFAAGNLFKAQRMDFGSWVDGKEYKSDFETYLQVKAVGDMCRKPGEAIPYPGGMELFIVKMVMPSPNTRKQRAEAAGMDKYREAWSAIIRREGWNWRPYEG